MHEGYFLQAPVDIETINKCADVICENSEVVAVRLQELGGSGPWKPSEFPFLWQMDRQSSYRISLQAGLWRKEQLSRFVRPHENPWQFEVWRSKRHAYRRGRILCMNRDIFQPETRPVLPHPYEDAVRKGRWNKEIACDLFAANDIDVDFMQRGFYDPSVVAPKRPLSERVLARFRFLL